VCNKAGVMWSFSVILSFVLYHSVSRITDERGNGRRPNLAGPDKRWPSRSGWLLVVIRICSWIPVFYFLRHWGLGDFPTFFSIYLFSQFSYNQQRIWTKLGEMNNTAMVHWPLIGGLLHSVQRVGPVHAVAPPSPLLAVPNVTAHPSTANVATS